MAIKVDIELQAVEKIFVKGWKNSYGILVEGEKSRLHNWPNNITFGGQEFTITGIEEGNITGSRGDFQIAQYVPSRR